MTQDKLRKNKCVFCKHSIKWTYLVVILDAQRKGRAWGPLEGHLKEPFNTARPKQFTLQADQRFVTYLPLSKFDCLRFPWVREHTCWCTGDPRLFWALSLFMTPELKVPGDLFCCGWPGLVLAPPGVMLSPGGRGNFGKDDACLKLEIKRVLFTNNLLFETYRIFKPSLKFVYWTILSYNRMFKIISYKTPLYLFWTSW